MNILLLSRYDTHGASSRVRSFQYLPYLHSKGCYIDVAPLFGNGYINNLYELRRNEQISSSIGRYNTQTDVPVAVLSKGPKVIFTAYFKRLIQLAKSKNYDLIWIEKEIFPWLPAGFEFVVARLGIPYVVDFDDAVFHKYDMHKSAVVRMLLGNKIKSVMRNSRVVIAGNAYLAQYARQIDVGRVEIIPSVVDHHKYLAKNNFLNDGIKNTFRIGWIGTPSTSIYLSSIEEALKVVSSRFSVELVVVGGGDIRFDGVNVVSIPWSEESEVQSIQSFDVGIMPLPDSPYEKGKCGYKLIQYMACGVPAIASPVGVNSSIINNGVNGFLAKTTQEWVDSIVLLIENKIIYSTISINGRKMIESEFNLDKWQKKLYEIFTEMGH